MSDPTTKTPGSTLLQLTSFMLGHEEYAVDIGAVQEIVRMTAITHVPRAPAFVEGVVNLRGKVIPVIDLRKRFDMAVGDDTKSTRIMIVQVGPKTIGLIVDGVKEVLRIDSESVSPTPELVSGGIDNAYLKGVGQIGDRLIIMLDLMRLLSPDEMAALAQTAA